MLVRLAATLVLLVAAAAAAPAEAKRVRAFAVGPKFDLSWVDTREHYRAHLVALMDARERGRLPASIQRGAADVASHQLGPADPARPAATARDLIALPEDVGLFVALSGSRGAVARRITPETGGLTASIGSLLVSYAPLVSHYGRTYPELTGRGVPTRLLALALTDTFGRYAVETFAELADRHDAYLEAGVNMARDWRIVCRSRATFEPPPGATGCDEENPGKVDQLRDPDEPQRDYAYEAATDQPVNMALIFDPDGRLISKQVKTYLTPVELPGQLDLVPGDVSSGLSALQTPVGVLGFVTSKDAWMPDVTAKLDQRGVEILVQPEFFVNDTVRREGMWAPDTLKASGYADVLRHPSIEALVLPELTGNVYDFSADAQQHVVLEPRGSRPPLGGLVGQPPAPGFAAVQEWVVRDPEREGEAMPDRRERLGRAGEAMLPTGGGPACVDPTVPGPCRGGQVEGVIFADVEVGEARPRKPVARRRRGRTPFSVSRAIAPSKAPQRNVALAARGRRAWAAWEQGRWIRMARSADGGRTWSRPWRPVRRPAGHQWLPDLDVGRDGRVWLVWQDDSSGAERAYFSVSDRRGRRFGAPRAIDGGGDPAAPQWRPAVAALAGGGAYAAWVDERAPVAGERALREAGTYGARLGRDGATEPGRRLDEGAPVALAAAMNHAWAPDVAARGRDVLVTWTDFSRYDWDVLARVSADGGATFAPEQTVNDTPEADEALDDTPRATFLAGRPWIAWTDFRKRASSAREPHQLHDVMGGEPDGADLQLDAHGAEQLLAFAPSAAGLPGGSVVVAWQDHRRGHGDVVARRVRAGGRLGPAVRVDDSGRAGWNQWRPEVAAAGKRVLAAWEDERDGPPNVFFAHTPMIRLP
jgi:predicted amidohydrolase